jgi:hypothetical protein
MSDDFDQQMKLEHYKADLELHREQYRAKVHAARDNFKAVIAMGQSAIKNTLIVNAGAAVAILAFIGKGGAFVFPDLYEALLRFGLGVFCSIVAGGTAYISQVASALSVNASETEKGSVVGWAVQGFSCLLIMAAYLFFLWGTYLAYSTFRGV